jgi:hypothetical protein
MVRNRGKRINRAHVRRGDRVRRSLLPPALDPSLRRRRRSAGQARATADIDGATFVLDWVSQSPNDFDLDAARLVLGDSSAVFSDGFD